MQRSRSTIRRTSRAGFTLLEALIAISLLAVAIFATMRLLDSSRRYAASSVGIATLEDIAGGMLYDIERELVGAALEVPSPALSAILGPGDTLSVSLATTAGLPPFGELLASRGTPAEEVFAYASLSADGQTALTLARGLACTQPTTHAAGSEVLWRGLAEPIPIQDNPAVGTFDGICLEDVGAVYFRGQGTGVVYRLPVDVTGGGDPIEAGAVTLGAELSEFGPTATGYAAMYFAPRDTFDEAARGHDINGDGDMDDVFDVGQLRRVVWDAADPTRVEDVGISPTAILQERCAWGADLDADGYADPMFLCDPQTHTIHVRIHLIGRALEEQPIVRKLESVLYLRNDPDA